MTDITPPPELAMHFRGVPLIPPLDCSDPQSWIAEQIYQIGADQELEACVAWLDGYEREGWAAQQLRAARRPKPPNLKEQALKAAQIELDPTGKNGSLIIRALEALPDD